MTLIKKRINKCSTANSLSLCRYETGKHKHAVTVYVRLIEFYQPLSDYIKSNFAPGWKALFKCPLWMNVSGLFHYHWKVWLCVVRSVICCTFNHTQQCLQVLESTCTSIYPDDKLNDVKLTLSYSLETDADIFGLQLLTANMFWTSGGALSLKVKNDRVDNNSDKKKRNKKITYCQQFLACWFFFCTLCFF